MTIATVVKAVPDLEKMRFDPETKTMRRDGAPLFLNAFDLHAAIAAASLKRPNEATVIVSMGPPEARAPLVRALALGSDRGVLVSDRGFSGSDTSVTGRVLAAVLRPLAPDVVLAGRSSTDASTGQVPAQLAELLDLPMVGGVRALRWNGPSSLEVVGETETGWSRYSVTTPCLVAVSEKVNPSRSPGSEDLRRAEADKVEVRTRADLGLLQGEVGAEGSPTVVLGLENEEPARSTVVLRDGPLAARCREAADRVGAVLAKPTSRPNPVRVPRPSSGADGEVMVVASAEDGGVDPGALPLLTEVLRLPEPFWPSAVGFGKLDSGGLDALARAGAAEVCWWPDLVGWVPPRSAAECVERALADRPRAAGGLFLSTEWGREVAGRVSSRLGLGLTGDAVGIRPHAEFGLTFEKPSFGGGLVATVASRRAPSLATVRPGSFEEGTVARNGSDLHAVLRRGGVTDGAVRRLATGVEKDPTFGDLGRASVVVGIGMGLGGPEHIPAVLDAIRPLRAALAATRKVVDAGWVPAQLQVGLTGRSIAPDLYVAVGVSGKANHLVGVKRARVTVGINVRPEEPLFSRVDVGIVGDGLEAVRELVPALARVLGGPPSLRD